VQVVAGERGAVVWLRVGRRGGRRSGFRHGCRRSGARLRQRRASALRRATFGFPARLTVSGRRCVRANPHRSPCPGKRTFPRGVFGFGSQRLGSLYG